MKNFIRIFFLTWLLIFITGMIFSFLLVIETVSQIYCFINVLLAVWLIVRGIKDLIDERVSIAIEKQFPKDGLRSVIDFIDHSSPSVRVTGALPPSETSFYHGRPFEHII